MLSFLCERNIYVSHLLPAPRSKQNPEPRRCLGDDLGGELRLIIQFGSRIQRPGAGEGGMEGEKGRGREN